jgi:D-3-phosphoglycerate dehydrogenase
MALSMVRHIAFYDRDVRAGKWHFTSPGKLRRVTDLTLGILGLGRIGKRLAYIGRDCFKQAIACDPYIDAGEFPLYARSVDLETLFREADLLSVHVPLNDETRGIVNANTLALMKPGSWVVNTARGAVVDVDALLAALDTGRLDGAALDVLPMEPPPPGHPLLTHPRILVTPHAAFYSAEAERELRRKAAQNLVDWARTGRPRYVVSEGK